MSYERSVGAIIVKRGEPPRAEPYFLLLRYPGGYWEFPRGHIEAGERELVTARREIREETGITALRFLPGFRQRYRFQFQREGKRVMKDAVIYLAEVSRWTVRVSDEHFGYVWATYREAVKHLGFENARQVLRKAASFLGRAYSARVTAPVGRRPASSPSASPH